MHKPEFAPAPPPVGDLRPKRERPPGFLRESFAKRTLSWKPGGLSLALRMNAAYFLALPWLATALILASMVAGSPM